MKIDEEFVTNLRFADDIFLCTEAPQISALLMNYSCSQKHHKNYNIHVCYNNYHRRTGQHPFWGADRVLPEWIRWGGGGG